MRGEWASSKARWNNCERQLPLRVRSAKEREREGGSKTEKGAL